MWISCGSHVDLICGSHVDLVVWAQWFLFSPKLDGFFGFFGFFGFLKLSTRPVRKTFEKAHPKLRVHSMSYLRSSRSWRDKGLSANGCHLGTPGNQGNESSNSSPIKSGHGTGAELRTRTRMTRAKPKTPLDFEKAIQFWKFWKHLDDVRTPWQSILSQFLRLWTLRRLKVAMIALPSLRGVRIDWYSVTRVTGNLDRYRWCSEAKDGISCSEHFRVPCLLLVSKCLLAALCHVDLISSWHKPSRFWINAAVSGKKHGANSFWDNLRTSWSSCNCSHWFLEAVALLFEIAAIATDFGDNNATLLSARRRNLSSHTWSILIIHVFTCFSHTTSRLSNNK